MIQPQPWRVNQLDLHAAQAAQQRMKMALLGLFSGQGRGVKAKVGVVILQPASAGRQCGLRAVVAGALSRHRAGSKLNIPYEGNRRDAPGRSGGRSTSGFQAWAQAYWPG